MWNDRNRMPLVLEENSSLILLQSGPACNGTDLLVRQYLSKQSAHLAENLNQVASYSRLLIVKGGSMKI